MSDPKDDKTNDPNRERAPLTLKPRVAGNVSTGTVKQSFSHGRSKTVVVETKRRIGAPPMGAAPSHPPRPGPETNLARPNPPAQRTGQQPQARPNQSGGGGLRQEEQDARQRAIQAALAEQQRRDAEARTQAAREGAARAVADVAARPAPAPEAAPVEARAPEAPPAVVQPAPQPQAQPVEARAPEAPRSHERPQAERPAFRNERSPRHEGRQDGPRSDRPQGDRPQGDRPPFNRDRPQGDRPQGDRPPFNRDRP
ncbi:MAG: translation initiation factor IF-2 associated domain-containing protein, partial [Asticcacaulis sp.]|nr:translation initiation factor IF-2 associated domain-containing protein [Asticcacaulis sp.]